MTINLLKLGMVAVVLMILPFFIDIGLVPLIVAFLLYAIYTFYSVAHKTRKTVTECDKPEENNSIPL